MKSKFKNIRKQKEKAVSEPVEKEEILVVSCIGGIILTAMNDHILTGFPLLISSPSLFLLLLSFYFFLSLI